MLADGRASRWIPQPLRRCRKHRPTERPVRSLGAVCRRRRQANRPCRARARLRAVAVAAATAGGLAKRAGHQDRLGPVAADPEDHDRVVSERFGCQHQDPVRSSRAQCPGRSLTGGRWSPSGRPCIVARAIAGSRLGRAVAAAPRTGRGSARRPAGAPRPVRICVARPPPPARLGLCGPASLGSEAGRRASACADLRRSARRPAGAPRPVRTCVARLGGRPARLGLCGPASLGSETGRRASACADLRRSARRPATISPVGMCVAPAPAPCVGCTHRRRGRAAGMNLARQFRWMQSACGILSTGCTQRNRRRLDRPLATVLAFGAMPRAVLSPGGTDRPRRARCTGGIAFGGPAAPVLSPGSKGRRGARARRTPRAPPSGPARPRPVLSPGATIGRGARVVPRGIAFGGPAAPRSFPRGNARPRRSTYAPEQWTSPARGPAGIDRDARKAAAAC